MEVNAGMGKMEPRVRLAFYRTKFYPEDQPITCTFCGCTLQHQFQTPHLSVFCPKYVISCPHSRIGCEWNGTASVNLSRVPCQSSLSCALSLYSALWLLRKRQKS
jgi:hypothetical protein